MAASMLKDPALSATHWRKHIHDKGLRPENRHKPLLALCLVAAFALSARADLNPAAGGTSPSSGVNGPADNAKRRISVLPLDFSRAPKTDDLMAAGQLGGVLYPTHELPNKARDEAARLDFAQAIEQWNNHQYSESVQLFRRHAERFPDSPWAAEATLHVGCDATYNGRYTEAEGIFTQLIATYNGNEHPGAKMMLNKARQRLALVKVEQNNLEEATALFLDLQGKSTDWRQRTYAAHWLQRLSRYRAAREALVNCGAEALAYLLSKEGNQAAAKKVQEQLPPSMRGHNLSDLVKLAAAHGYALAARHVSLTDLPHLPLPAVLHISQGGSGDKGHYWVLDKVQNGQVEMYDPQSRRRFHQTTGELAVQWNGDVLLVSRGAQLPGRAMDTREMEEAIGGCCGAPAPPDNNGDPGGNGGEGGGCAGGDDGGGGGSPPFGAPRWTVDMISLNMYVKDIPLWYDSPIGPKVQIALNYNSQSSIAHYEPFGNKWTFSYGGYLLMDTSGTIIVSMPDGRQDVYTPDGHGGYIPPFQLHNTLTQISPNNFKLQFPSGTAYLYQIPAGTSSQQPFLTEIDDPYGQKLTLGYAASMQLTTITDAQGNVFRLSYNSSGLVTNVADPFGRNAIFAYDANNNLVQITDMGGYWTTFSYDTNAFLASIGDARGTTSFWTELPGPPGANSDNYPPPGDPDMFACYRITVTNPLGALSEYFYYGGCDIDGYGGCGGYSWYVSPRDYIPWQSQSVNNYRSRAPKTRYLPTRVGPGRRGMIAEILYPEGDFSKYTYDPVTGDRLTVTDAHGNVSKFTYNSMGLPTSSIDPRATLTTFSYATNGVDLLSISNRLGSIQMTYDPQHDLLSLTDRLGNRTAITYNQSGRISSLVDALGITNEYTYDASGHLSRIDRGGYTLDSFTYDGTGRVQTHTDPTGLTLAYTYNRLNQVLRIDYPDGLSQSYAYSTCCPGLIDSLTDRAGRLTQFSYDALKRLTQIINPESGATRLAYDPNGNQIAQTDPNGNRTSFSYDPDNRLSRKSYADGKGYSLGYDQAGLLTTRTNARGVVATYSYDANNNRLTTVYSDGLGGVTNVYDAFNRLVASTDEAGTNVFVYDANSRLIRSDGPWDNDTVTYSYDALGQRTTVAVLGGQPVTYSYDSLNRLSAVRVNDSSYSYSYAGGSQLVQRLDRPNGSYTTYAYDSLNRLVDLANAQAGGQIVNEFSYTYNAEDLRDTETISNGLATAFSGSQLITTTCNELNQLVTLAPAGQLFAYDPDGNMIQGYTPAGSLFSARYDAANHLKSLVYTNGGVVLSNEYIYTGNGFLARWRQFQDGALAGDTLFVRAGHLPLQERGSDGTVARQYAWGLGLDGGVGGLLDLAQAGQHYSYLYDGIGNVTALLDAAQTASVRYAYEPFGALIATDGSLDQPMRFSTKLLDSNAGLSYFGHRFYSVAVARWLTRDPAGEAEGDNLYEFVRDSPINYIDPQGLSIWLCTRAVGGFPFVGRHAYLWDDRYNTSCSMRGSSGSGPNSGAADLGPGFDQCTKVEDSAGKEDNVMNCCRSTANNGLWFPGHDCHSASARCLESNGLTPPPHKRWGCGLTGRNNCSSGS
jgi:RHS repeat-associated protein